MHMADALISGAVGGTMLAASAAVATHSVRKINNEMDEKKIPLMGVMGAFVFAAQMINFTIPGTGSSGHLGGGMLLAILLGPYAGFLTMAAILLIQALFFGDGGLLAYGCNLFNMGFYTCFIAYPFIYKLITKKEINTKRIFIGTMLASVIALQLGAFSVVIETSLSHKTELPFSTFVMLMQPIHLAIGIVEGLVTGAVVTFVWKSRPEILEKTAKSESLGYIPMKKVLAVLVVAVIFVGGIVSWFSSTNPDGLEWSMEKTAGTIELDSPGGIHDVLSNIQDKTTLLPDYSFKSSVNEEKEEKVSWPSMDVGTSVSGIIGGILTLVISILIGYAIKLAKGKFNKAEK